jgi:hypothetical protein
MGAMPFAQHPAQKHREPSRFCNRTFGARASRAWPAPTLDFLPGNAPRARCASSRVYCARFQVTRGLHARVETGSR